MIDFELLERLLEMLDRSGAGSIEVRKSFWGGTSVRVSKGPATNSGPVTYQVATGSAPSAPPPASQTPRGDAGGTETGGDATAPTANLIEIKAPLVGTFYTQPEPGAEAYVKVGSRVSPGTTLCIIEAMKIMNPLEAEVSGVITEICVQDAQPVEFGQVLFRVDSNG